MSTRRAVLYARLSISSDESVSIDRQLEAGRAYAAARNWSVVAEYRDDGVSATKNKPEDRAGWRALLETRAKYDAVVIWKVDRLARRVLDFLHADEALRERGAGIVAVDDPIDMTTAQGRGFATMLAVFGEMEAAAISARVAAARTHLLKSGRVVGGTVPYGWASVKNPDGPGFVLRRDPERIDWVRGMVERCQRGESIYKITQWLDAEGAPVPSTSQANRKRQGWNYQTVERLLRHPVLAGATPFNPGNDSRARGVELLRDERGLPVVDESVAIMTLGEWRAMVTALDERDTPQAKSRPLRSETSALLSGLLYCGDERHEEPVKMWRGTVQGRPGYYCRECHHAITNFEEVLIDEFLRQKGDWVRWSRATEVHEGGAAELPEVELRIAEESAALGATDDDAEAEAIAERLTELRALRRKLRAEPGQVAEVWNPSDHYFSELWAIAGDDVEERRAVLQDAVERVIVKRGRPGRRTPAQVLERLQIAWKRPEELGPRPLG